MSIHLCPTPSKTPYSTKRVAKSATRMYGGRKRLRVYECRCGSWHLTKVRNAKKRRLRLARA